jgi:hypothetical protein
MLTQHRSVTASEEKSAVSDLLEYVW